MLRIEVTHGSTDCYYRNRGWVCHDEAHHLVVVDGKALPERKGLDAALRAAAAGSGKSDVSGRSVRVCPEAKVEYALVWSLLESCAKAGLHRFVWTAAEDKAPAKRSPSGRSPSEVWIRIEDPVDGVVTQLEDGPRISENGELLEALRAANVDGDTTAVIAPDGGIPWSEVARHIELCSQSGIGRVEFLGLPPFPPGYSSQVTEEESAELARILDQASAEDQPAVLDHLLDRHEMFRRMVRSVPISVRVRHRIAFMFLPGILTGRTFSSIPGSPRPLQLLGMSPYPGVSRPVFRIRTETHLDYVELVLARRWDGRIRVVDMFSLRLGGLQSEERTNLVPSLTVLRLLNEMRGLSPDDFLMEEDSAFTDLLHLLGRKAHRELVELFQEKQDAFKRSKKAHRLHVYSAAQIDADAFLRAVRGMKECFPGDPSLLLLELQGALAKQDLKGTLQATDALERRVKKDPHLDIIRARAHLTAGDPAAARPFAAKAIEGESDFAGGWWLLVEICLAQKDFKAVAETLSRIEEKLALEIGDLESSPPYAEFVKSKEYRLWSEARRRDPSR